MTETWLPFAIRRPGPEEKQGYPGVSSRTLEDVEGEVKHSTEGHLSAALGELMKLSRQASWHLTIDWDGTVYQHYPLEAVLWHCGLPGDRRQDTSLIGNITLVGEEHVDRLPDGTMLAELTGSQQNSSALVSRSVRLSCPSVRANPPTLRKNLWEHGWLSATVCPSGLIPWGKLIPKMEVEDLAQVPQSEWNEALAHLRNIDSETDQMIQQWPWMMAAVSQLYAITFDPANVTPDSQSDYRRMVHMSANIRALLQHLAATPKK